MDLSIIIVNYNTFQLTQNAVESVNSSIGGAIEYEIIIIDNASSEDTQRKLAKTFSSAPHVNLILNRENLGFSKANNIGIRLSSGDYILLLNSDTLVQDNCIPLCLDYIRHNEQIGALGCKLLLEDGSLDHACKRGFPTPDASLYYFLKLHKLFPKSKRFGKYTLSYQDINEINEVDSLTGAFMLLPRSTIDRVGLLDEEFFMYGEDIDWCYRIKKAGYSIIYYPKAATIHLKGQSSKRKKSKIIYEFHRAMLLFYNKHYRSQYPLWVTWLMYAGVYIKMTLAYAFNFLKKNPK